MQNWKVGIITMSKMNEIKDALSGFIKSVGDKLEPVSKKCDAFFEKTDEKVYDYYMNPKGKTVAPKTSYIIVGVSALVMLLLGFYAIIWLGTYDYYTTGITVEDFIKEFNAISSASDVTELIPDYQDIVIPEGTKLGGRHTIELFDGHVVVSAKTRFGKIVSLEAKGVDIPSYDETTCLFDKEAPDNDYFNYFIALGKIGYAADECKYQPKEPVNQPDENPSQSDVSAADGSVVPKKDENLTSKGRPQKRVYDAMTLGYQFYYYSYSTKANGGSGYAQTNTGDIYVAYDLETETLTVAPQKPTLTKLPDKLQAFVDSFKKSDEGEDEQTNDSAVSTPSASNTDASNTDTSSDSDK